MHMRYLPHASIDIYTEGQKRRYMRMHNERMRIRIRIYGATHVQIGQGRSCSAVYVPGNRGIRIPRSDSTATRVRFGSNERSPCQ